MDSGRTMSGSRSLWYGACEEGVRVVN